MTLSNDSTPTCIDCGQPSDLDLNPSGLWCTRCENERRERITASMAKITASFDAALPGTQP